MVTTWNGCENSFGKYRLFAKQLAQIQTQKCALSPGKSPNITQRRNKKSKHHFAADLKANFFCGAAVNLCLSKVMLPFTNALYKMSTAAGKQQSHR